MTQIYTKRTDDRRNRRYEMTASIYLTVEPEPLLGKAKIPNDFVHLDDRFRTHAENVVLRSNLKKASVRVLPGYSTRWIVAVDFRADRPKEIVSAHEAEAFAEGMVPGLEEIAVGYAAEIASLNEQARTQERIEELARWMVEEGRGRAMRAINYEDRIEAIRDELREVVQKHVEDFVREVGGVVEYDDGTREPANVVDLAGDLATEEYAQDETILFPRFPRR